MNNDKMLCIRIDKELHKKLKIVTAEKEVSIQEFVVNLINKSVNKLNGVDNFGQN